MDISLAMATFKNAVDIFKSLSPNKKDSDKLLELHNSFHTLHATNLVLHSQNDELLKLKAELEKRLIKCNDFRKEKARYELREICSGVYLYATKESHKDKEPPHYICPNCYQEHRKSILQVKSRSSSGTTYQCTNPACKAQFTHRLGDPPSIGQLAMSLNGDR